MSSLLSRRYAAVPVTAAVLFAAACADRVNPVAPPASPGALTDLVPQTSPITGSIKTTLASCKVVNANVQYTDKQQVYLSGGNGKLGPLGPDGDYFVRVTSPAGTVLGTSGSDATYHVTGGIPECVAVWGLVTMPDGTTPGYRDTDNPGGEYKVEVCADQDFTPSRCKSDNFKVRTGSTPEGENGYLEVQKFYDANANGIRDGVEALIPWSFKVADASISTSTALLTWLSNPFAAASLPQSVTVSEILGGAGKIPGTPVSMYASYSWTATTPTDVEAVITSGTTNLVEFGNRCTATTGTGHTLGWYANNGNSSVTPNELQYLSSSLYLVYGTKDGAGKNGTRFQPTTNKALATWLLNANSANSANMLSVQLATAWLNTQPQHGYSAGEVIVDGTHTLSGEIAYASGLVAADPLGATTKALQTNVQTILNSINNGIAGPLVQPIFNPAVCPSPS